MTPGNDVAEVTEDLETRMLPKLREELLRLKSEILAARDRLPQAYPELAEGKPSRQALLHGDLGILAGALDEAMIQARTAATGVEEDEEREEDMREKTRVQTEIDRLLQYLGVLLVRSGKTHREVAKEIGLGAGVFALVMCGDRPLKFWELLAVLDAVDVAPRDFFEEAGAGRREPSAGRFPRRR